MVSITAGVDGGDVGVIAALTKLGGGLARPGSWKRHQLLWRSRPGRSQKHIYREYKAMHPNPAGHTAQPVQGAALRSMCHAFPTPSGRPASYRTRWSLGVGAALSTSLVTSATRHSTSRPTPRHLTAAGANLRATATRVAADAAYRQWARVSWGRCSCDRPRSRACAADAMSPPVGSRFMPSRR